MCFCMDRNLFIHPEDEAALRKLEAVPGFDLLLKKFMSIGYETMFYGENMGSSIRLSSNQLPQIYKILPPICEKLGIEEPEFYLQMNPIPNAWTFGDTRIYVTVTSGLVEMLDEEELISVVGHECGHILCRHVLYHNLGRLLGIGVIQGAEMALGPIAKLATTPLMLALAYWSRKSELSADRAGAIVTSPDVVCRVQARLAGGPKSITENVNMEEWASQADQYDDIYNSNTWNKALQICLICQNDHPLAAVRVREMLKWKNSNEYSQLLEYIKNPSQHSNSTFCPNCGGKIESDWIFCRHCGTKL